PMTVASIVFFFSSRRRHTRLQGDWSSDVCSSDLRDELIEIDRNALAIAVRSEVPHHHARSDDLALDVHVPRLHASRKEARIGERSEERRVGKEWRWKWARNH